MEVPVSDTPDTAGSLDSFDGAADFDEATDRSFETARAAADALADKKGLDIVLLDVADLIVITDVFVIATGTSRPHVQSLAESVDDRLRQLGRRRLREEGKREAEWVLLDYGDVVVHVFQPGTRDFYGLERLWGDAPRIEWAPEGVEA